MLKPVLLSFGAFVVFSSQAYSQSTDTFNGVEPVAEARPIELAYNAFIEAFNTGDREIYRQFIVEWFDDEGQVAPSDIEAFSGEMFEVYRRLGSVEITSVELNRDNIREAWVTGELTGGQSLILVQLGPDGTISGTGNTSGIRARRTVNRLDEVTPESLRAVLDPYFGALVEGDHFSGGAWVNIGDEVVYSFHGGDRDRRTGESISSDTLFNPASVGKMITATVVLSLVEEGTISLDDTIGDWIPDYPEPWASGVTIANLLTHTSGIELDNDDVFMSQLVDARSISEMVELQIEHVERVLSMNTFNPGQDFNYTNEGYILLGSIAEVASGEGFETLLQERVFLPAGMTRTFPTSRLEGQTNVAVPHSLTQNRGEGAFFEEVSALAGTDTGQNWLDNGVAIPASPVYSTGTDLIRFMTALMGGQLINNDMVEAMVSRIALRANEDMFGLLEHQGLGIRIVNEYGVESFGHDGGVPGFRTKLYYYPDNDMTILTWSNSEGALAPAHQHIEDLTAVRRQ
ncbi:MAG: serine hydrolase [Alphaproteobacteria bacterium]|nr:serine hydrolase [Alphaproteobacteria bacterium]